MPFSREEGSGLDLISRGTVTSKAKHSWLNAIQFAKHIPSLSFPQLSPQPSEEEMPVSILQMRKLDFRELAVSPTSHSGNLTN